MSTNVDVVGGLVMASKEYLKGKTIVISGAGSGMGYSTALLIASYGANLSLADLNGKAVDQTNVATRSQISFMNDGGSIINVSSVLGLGRCPNTAEYCASKYGVVGLSKCAALEVARKGIRVNVIAPGPIDTPLMAGSLKAFKETTGVSWEKRIPMGRMGRPQEVADLVEFLLSHKSRYVTGSVTTIDGGYTI